MLGLPEAAVEWRCRLRDALAESSQSWGHSVQPLARCRFPRKFNGHLLLSFGDASNQGQ